MIYIFILLPIVFTLIYLIMLDLPSKRRTKRRKTVMEADGYRRRRILAELEHTSKIKPAVPLKTTSEERPVILIVDDQSAIRALLVEALSDDGYLTLDAPHGQAGIELFYKHYVDLVIFDLKMPDIDGIEMLTKLHELRPDIRSIMISAYGDPDKVEAGTQMGMLCLFTKPFDIDALRSFVREHLTAAAVEKPIA